MTIKWLALESEVYLILIGCYQLMTSHKKWHWKSCFYQFCETKLTTSATAYVLAMLKHIKYLYFNAVSDKLSIPSASHVKITKTPVIQEDIARFFLNFRNRLPQASRTWNAHHFSLYFFFTLSGSQTRRVGLQSFFQSVLCAFQ